MTNIKFTQVISLPVQSEKGCVYFVSDGTLHLGKSDGTYLEVAKSDSDILFVTSLPTDNVEENKLYVLLNEGKLTIHIYDGTQFIDLSPSAHQHTITDVTNLQTELDKKAKQTDLNTTNSNVTDLQEDVSNLSQTVTSNHSELTEHLTEIEWFDATLVNGFEGSIKYSKNKHNIVFLRINITKITSNTIGTNICTLPVGFRPFAVLPIVTLRLTSPFGGTFAFSLSPFGELNITDNNGLSIDGVVRGEAVFSVSF